MSKIDLSTITTDYASRSVLNANFETIQDAIDNTVSRDGTADNTMSADFDMNSNHILNLPTPSYKFDPIRLTDVETLMIRSASQDGRLSIYTVASSLNDLTLAEQTALGAVWVKSVVDGVEAGGGVFVFSSDAITPCTGMAYAPSDDTTGDSGGMVRVIPEPGVYDTAWFGQVADGSTDDSTAVQLALDTARTDGAALVRLWQTIAGTCLTGIVIPAGVTLDGGYRAPVESSSPQIPHVAATGSDRWVFTLGVSTAPGSGAAIEGVALIGQGEGVTQGGIANNCRKGVIENCLVRNFGEEGIYNGYAYDQGTYTTFGAEFSFINRNVVGVVLLNHYTTSETDFIGALTIGGHGECIISHNEISGGIDTTEFKDTTSEQICAYLEKCTAGCWAHDNLFEWGDHNAVLNVSTAHDHTYAKFHNNRLDYGTSDALYIVGDHVFCTANQFICCSDTSTSTTTTTLGTNRTVIRISGDNNTIADCHVGANDVSAQYYSAIEDTGSANAVDIATVYNFINGHTSTYYVWDGIFIDNIATNSETTTGTVYRSTMILGEAGGNPYNATLTEDTTYSPFKVKNFSPSRYEFYSTAAYTATITYDVPLGYELTIRLIGSYVSCALQTHGGDGTDLTLNGAGYYKVVRDIMPGDSVPVWRLVSSSS